MPVPTKPNRQRINYDRDFTWEQLAKNCLLNKYALVVGSEAILNRDVNPEAGGNSMKLLFDLTLQYKASMSTQDGQEEDEYLRLKSRVKNFSELVREYNYHSVREWVLETVRDNDFLPNFNQEIEPSLMQLLQLRCFRLVLATSIDPYLEIAMEKVWGKGNFEVVQIEDAQQLFKPVTFDEFGVTKPTLCYVFGKVNANISLSENHFVLSENDAMEKISNWFENHKNNRFLKYVRNFRLLSIGCQFDDWMFRFFWFLLRGRVGTEADGQVAVEVTDDDKLKHYLEQEKVKVFASARSFMQEACKHISKAADVKFLPRKENGVFISYAHEDRYIALPLFERLHAAGINVWIDEEKLESGAEYEQRIRRAINTCRIFMPILSSQVKSDLTSHNIESRWYRQEWQWIQNRYDDETNINDAASFKVIPFVVDGYGFNEPYHQQLPPCLIGATAFENAKDNIDYLIKRINT